MEQAVDEELRRVQQHANENEQVLHLLAQALDVSPDDVDSALYQGGLTRKRERLRKLITVITDSESVVKGNYGRLYWQGTSNIYEATERAIRLYKE